MPDTWAAGQTGRVSREGGRRREGGSGQVEDGVGRCVISLTGRMDCFRSIAPESVSMWLGLEGVKTMPWTRFRKA